PRQSRRPLRTSRRAAPAARAQAGLGTGRPRAAAGSAAGRGAARPELARDRFAMPPRQAPAGRRGSKPRAPGGKGGAFGQTAGDRAQAEAAVLPWRQIIWSVPGAPGRVTATGSGGPLVGVRLGLLRRQRRQVAVLVEVELAVLDAKHERVPLRFGEVQLPGLWLRGVEHHVQLALAGLVRRGGRVGRDDNLDTALALLHERQGYRRPHPPSAPVSR